MSYKIVALPGDGIGPEILSGTLELLKLISEKYHFEYHLESHHFGGISIDN
ncbi:MAG: isocitrate/isopropylmalate family dehydrogenase, partial [Staphylococcus epidermidis]|nr:isocitrate/isopropylmalate family dehydrogenase [Staphylococcus epidermidis]